MNHIVTAIVIAGSLILPASANAGLTVTPGLTVNNLCHKDIIVAVHYKDSRGRWSTTPFTTIRARTQKNAVVSSDNGIFYFYAETTTDSPVRWTGERNITVQGKTYPMQEIKRNLDRQRNRYLLELTCDN
jgi:uncharacterized membrane protein